MQLLTQGQWWSKSWAGATNASEHSGDGWGVSRVQGMEKSQGVGRVWSGQEWMGGTGMGVGEGRHLYAVVTDTAVGAPWRAVEVAGGAPLHADLDAPHIHVLVQRGAEVILLVLIFIRCGKKVSSW